MRVLITGGYGFLGSWIVKDLFAGGHSIFLYDIKQDAERLEVVLNKDIISQTTFCEGNVTDQDRLIRTIREHGITHIVHLAGLQVPTCRANPVLGAQVNVMGTLAIFEAYKECRNQVKRVVYASSAAVFGPQQIILKAPFRMRSAFLPAPTMAFIKSAMRAMPRFIS